MQKIAVALTTQEEFNEYMKYNQNINQASIVHIKQAITVRGRVGVNVETGGRETIQYFQVLGYKIISLKEAIGEKEERESFKDGYDVAKEERESKFLKNKEIIREGEARGFEPKTGDQVMVSDNESEWHKRLYIATLDCNGKYKYSVMSDPELGKGERNRFEVTNWKYIKPIEEPKRDWISNMKDNLKSESKVICADFGDGIIEAVPFEYLREAIEKHMPRISKDEVGEIERWDSRVGTKYVHVPQLLDLLRSKGLLE